MERILIDSDVVIDHLTERKPFSKYATRLFAICEAKSVIGYLTPVIVANTYYILRQKNTREEVVEKLKRLLSIVEVLEMSKITILEALNSEFSDFEDALQHFAATKHGEIDLILTRNVKDYKKSEIPVMTPEAYLNERNSGRI